MRGAKRDPFDSPGSPDGGDASAPSRHLTPPLGLAPESDRPNDAANEDFLFHLYRGSELLQDNRAHEAKEELERALHRQPHDTKGQDLLAVVYFRLGFPLRAIAIFEELRRECPRDPALLLNLALCYLKTGQASLARRNLERLLEKNPTHLRAWGYLGLACEQLGALDDAQHAFEQGGHRQMAQRLVERRASRPPPPAFSQSTRAHDSGPSREVREAIAAAFAELDADELSFELAKPSSDAHEEGPDSWRPVELGNRPRRSDSAPVSARPARDDARPVLAQEPETQAEPRPAPIPQIGSPPAAKGLRHTLMVRVAPPHELAELEALSRVHSQRTVSFDMGTFDLLKPPSERTLAPPPARDRSGALVPLHAPAARLAPGRTAGDQDRAASAVARPSGESVVAFPEAGRVALHGSGAALVHTAPDTGFAVRLEALRASSNNLDMKLLERQAKGTSTGESFGGVGSPVVHVTGDGQLLLSPRSGRTLSSFALDDAICFVREDVLLGFDGVLTFENGRLAGGEGEFVPIVQLRGTGAVLIECIGEVLALEVQRNQGLRVRREVLLGWFGQLVPRALTPGEAPGGQRGLFSFAGVGRILVASA